MINVVCVNRRIDIIKMGAIIGFFIGFFFGGLFGVLTHALVVSAGNHRDDDE